jgi:thymidylate synthase
MRIFKNCVEAVNEIKRDLYEMGTKIKVLSMQDKDVSSNDDYLTKEIEGYVFTILDTSDKDKITDNLEWCEQEHGERVSDNYINPGQAYNLREEVWNEFLHEGKFAYTYNERIRTQLPMIIEELMDKPTTRQAIIEIHNNILDIKSMGGKSRVPCSLSYQFMVRDNKLDVIYIMRSSDYFTHFKNDIWQAIALRDYISRIIAVKPGKLIMFVSSLHGYKKDFPKGEIF